MEEKDPPRLDSEPLAQMQHFSNRVLKAVGDQARATLPSFMLPYLAPDEEDIVEDISGDINDSANLSPCPTVVLDPPLSAKWSTTVRASEGERLPLPPPGIAHSNGALLQVPNGTLPQEAMASPEPPLPPKGISNVSADTFVTLAAPLGDAVATTEGSPTETEPGCSRGEALDRDEEVYMPSSVLESPRLLADGSPRPARKLSHPKPIAVAAPLTAFAEQLALASERAPQRLAERFTEQLQQCCLDEAAMGLTSFTWDLPFPAGKRSFINRVAREFACRVEELGFEQVDWWSGREWRRSQGKFHVLHDTVYDKYYMRLRVSWLDRLPPGECIPSLTRRGSRDSADGHGTILEQILNTLELQRYMLDATLAAQASAEAAFLQRQGLVGSDALDPAIALVNV